MPKMMKIIVCSIVFIMAIGLVTAGLSLAAHDSEADRNLGIALIFMSPLYVFVAASTSGMHSH